MERNEAMIRLLWVASTNIRNFMRRYMPSNVLLDAIRTRRGLKWGVPAMLLAIPYLLVANLSAEAAVNGGPGWLHLVVLVCIWSALKMVWIGPVSVVLLARVRIRESADAHGSRADRTEEPTMAGSLTTGRAPSRDVTGTAVRVPELRSGAENRAGHTPRHAGQATSAGPMRPGR